MSHPIVSDHVFHQYAPLRFLKLNRRIMIPEAVHWFKPNGLWKLNVDGSSQGNPGPAGCGIVILDTAGDIFQPEACYIGSASSLYEEAMALLRGLQLCSEIGLYSVAVETNSKVLVSFLANGALWPWHIFSVLHVTQGLLQLNSSSIVHIYREANSVADFFVGFAYGAKRSFSFSQATLPRKLRGLALLDQKGCPNIRLRPWNFS